ncbi:MAG: XRE family transcriptional regulator [Paraburkholderia sp.]|nr:MAG: XRE family transcriptional regulator [Paraburkholderia sp.]
MATSITPIAVAGLTRSAISTTSLRRSAHHGAAEATEPHPTHISSIERGERNISICNIARIANALGVPMVELVAAQASEAGTVTPVSGDTRNRYR